MIQTLAIRFKYPLLLPKTHSFGPLDWLKSIKRVFFMILWSSPTTFLLVLHQLSCTVWVCLWYQDRQRKQQGSAWRRRKRVMITLSEKDIWSRFCDATFYYKSTHSPWFTVTHWRAKQNNTGRNALTDMSMFPYNFIRL